MYRSKDDSLWTKFWQVSLYGAGVGLVTLPFEHPIDCVKTRYQASPSSFTSATQVAKIIYLNEGIRGFYAGVLPNGTRMVIKQAYRWPLMMLIPSIVRPVLPKDNSSLEKSVTGVIIASIETFIICPLERFKVWRMTHIDNKGQRTSFFRLANGPLYKELYRGFNALYAKQMVSWTSFLVADDIFRRLLLPKSNNKDNESEYSHVRLLLISTCVGICNTFTNMPFDVIKTQLQMANPVKNQSILSIGRQIVKKNGVLALYAGWRPRLLQYVVQSTIFELFSEPIRKYTNYSIHH
jgi:solute carrier family 25 ornithine transporter 2/15